MARSERSQALADIGSHLQLEGPRKWGRLRDRYRSVSEPTWWRWVSEVKTQIGTQLLAGAARREHELASPDGSAQRVDFLAAYHGLWADAKRLEAHALYDDGRVRSPAALDRSIRIRLKLLRQGLELERQIFSARAQRAFFDGLVAEIAAEAPALQKRLINRLRGFQQSVCGRGLSETRSEVEVGR